MDTSRRKHDSTQNKLKLAHTLTNETEMFRKNVFNVRMGCDRVMLVTLKDIRGCYEIS